MAVAGAVVAGGVYRLEMYGEVVLLATAALVAGGVGTLSALVGGMKGPAVVVLIVFFSGGAHCETSQVVIRQL